jgi:hypothetical protein
LILKDRIFSIQEDSEFEKLAIDVFRFQSTYNPVYSNWLKALNVSINEVNKVNDIPFLPIEFFKTHVVRCGNERGELIFKSSGTTSNQNSTHHIYDSLIYEKSILDGFSIAYGKPEDYEILALLPSYLERDDSSLVWMVAKLMGSRQEERFFLNDYEKLKEVLEAFKIQNRKVLLIGVSFALLDFALIKPPVWDNLIVLETGGMKGRKKEMIREELHSEIRKSWPLQNINSEYGMTELQSQAWMKEMGKFVCPPWMKVIIRDAGDPFYNLPKGMIGGINVIDLANLDSCSFIATGDLGKLHTEGSFEVLGRFDNSDIRGCNLLSEL